MRGFIVSAVLAVCTSSLPAFANPVTFEGSAAIEAVTQQCVNDGFNVDNYLTMTYEYANGTAGDSDALALLTGRAAFRMISAAPSGTLIGPVQTHDTVIGSRVGLFNYTSSSNLSISSLGGNTLATAVNLKVIGTINDVFVSGCTMTLHGLLVVRPIQ